MNWWGGMHFCEASQKVPFYFSVKSYFFASRSVTGSKMDTEVECTHRPWDFIELYFCMGLSSWLLTQLHFKWETSEKISQREGPLKKVGPSPPNPPHCLLLQSDFDLTEVLSFPPSHQLFFFPQCPFRGSVVCGQKVIKLVVFTVRTLRS